MLVFLRPPAGHRLQEEGLETSQVEAQFVRAANDLLGVLFAYLKGMKAVYTQPGRPVLRRRRELVGMTLGTSELFH